MTVLSKDHEAQLRNLIAGYGNSIRLSDIKANIAVLFVAIMMGTVLQFRGQYPHYLNVPVLLAPFIVIFFNLLASVYPRFPRAGRKQFPIWRQSNPGGFRVRRRSGARGRGAAGSMRAAVADSVLEEHNPSDRLSRLDWDDRRRRGAVVRELVTAVAAHAFWLTWPRPSDLARVSTCRRRQRAPPGIRWRRLGFHRDECGRVQPMLAHVARPPRILEWSCDYWRHELSSCRSGCAGDRRRSPTNVQRQPA